MKFKAKHGSYYKMYYTSGEYDILYIGNTWTYKIAYKYNGELIKHDNRIKWDSIKVWQAHINKYNSKVEEISKADVFLELL